MSSPHRQKWADFLKETKEVLFEAKVIEDQVTILQAGITEGRRRKQFFSRKRFDIGGPQYARDAMDEILQRRDRDNRELQKKQSRVMRIALNKVEKAKKELGVAERKIETQEARTGQGSATLQQYARITFAQSAILTTSQAVESLVIQQAKEIAEYKKKNRDIDEMCEEHPEDFAEAKRERLRDVRVIDISDEGEGSNEEEEELAPLSPSPCPITGQADFVPLPFVPYTPVKYHKDRFFE